MNKERFRRAVALERKQAKAKAEAFEARIIAEVDKRNAGQYRRLRLMVVSNFLAQGGWSADRALEAFDRLFLKNEERAVPKAAMQMMAKTKGELTTKGAR